MKFEYVFCAILIVAICTFITRLFPFIVFGRHKEIPPIIKYLGEILPPAVMAVLIVYCLKTVDFKIYNSYIAQFASILVVVGLHIWKRNTLISIFGGTACYMILVQNFFK